MGFRLIKVLGFGLSEFGLDGFRASGVLGVYGA